ncbi:hypothetical protein QYE76_057732 [Lolium multiflorum]|uniref:RING-type domain-containing protein n=1 Tax=Lolium multiflorum TaxID=4521 RepID=A0AAD8T5R4_LOLMU|nr:hypothetical protein QYE76_057732 [Lolium multiflorum]
MATNRSRRSATAPPIQHRIQMHTICFYEQAAPAGKFAVCVACYARSSIDFCRLGAARPHESDMQPGENSMTTFLVADPATLRSAAACHGALRGMLAALPELRSLRLSVDEWDAVVPADVVPEIVGAAGRGNGFTFCFHVAVHRRVIHDERALLMACREWRLASTALGEKDCGICLDGLERESAVQMTGCEHAFHRRCISEWISKATCPMCRGDIWRPALPEILELSFTGAPAQDMPDIE